MYCTTAPLDGYVTLPDRTPRTQMMMAHSICSKDFCDPQHTHPKKYYPPSAHFASIQIASIQIVSVRIDSIRATHHGQSVALAVDHRFHDLSLTCGTYYCRGNMENAVEAMDNRILKKTGPLRDNRGATHGKGYLRSLIQLGLMYPPFWCSTLEI